MNKYLLERFRIVTEGKLVPWWWRFAYLIPDLFRERPEILETFVKVAAGHDKAFKTLVETHVSAYLEKGTMPPAPIIAPILNVAEDIAAGREVTLRAGDYISLQTFARSQTGH
jgi:hypothetical protein